MPDKLGEMLAIATAILSLAAAVVFWLGFATREVKGATGAAVKTASTGLLAVLALGQAATLAQGGWFWLVPLGLALGALGDLMLALGGIGRFLAGVAAFGLGHLAYAGGFLWRGAELGFDEISAGEGLALGGRGWRWRGWPPCWSRPRSGLPRARGICGSRCGAMSG